MRERGRRVGEMFVPLSHGPGHAQCDFGEALAVIAGVERKVHYFVLDLPHSDGCFAKAYPAETTEAFLDGHVSAFAFLGGVPQSIVYDVRSWRWRRYWGMVIAAHQSLHRAPVPLPVRGPVRSSARGMTRARSKGCGLRAAHFLVPIRWRRVSRRSMRTWKHEPGADSCRAQGTH